MQSKLITNPSSEKCCAQGVEYISVLKQYSPLGCFKRKQIFHDGYICLRYNMYFRRLLLAVRQHSLPNG